MDSIYVLKWLGAAVPAISFFVILWALLDSSIPAAPPYGPYWAF